MSGSVLGGLVGSVALAVVAHLQRRGGHSLDPGGQLLHLAAVLSVRRGDTAVSN